MTPERRSELRAIGRSFKQDLERHFQEWLSRFTASLPYDDVEGSAEVLVGMADRQMLIAYEAAVRADGDTFGISVVVKAQEILLTERS